MEDIKTKRKGEGKKRRERNWAESTRLAQPTSRPTIPSYQPHPLSYLLLSASTRLSPSRDPNLKQRRRLCSSLSLHLPSLPLSVPVDSTAVAVPEPCAGLRRTWDCVWWSRARRGVAAAASRGGSAARWRTTASRGRRAGWGAAAARWSLFPLHSSPPSLPLAAF